MAVGYVNGMAPMPWKMLKRWPSLMNSGEQSENSWNALEVGRTGDIAENERNEKSNQQVDHYFTSLLALRFCHGAHSSDGVKTAAEAKGAEGNGPGDGSVNANGC